MITAYVKFRGEEVEVVYHDNGYEPNTNSHVIDWEFVGLDASAYDVLNVSHAEEEEIYAQLYKISEMYD